MERRKILEEDIEDRQIIEAKIKQGTLTKPLFGANILTFDTIIPLQGSDISIDTGSTGVKDVFGIQRLPSLEQAVYAYAEFSNTALAAGAAASFEIYDVTAAAVRSTTTIPADGSERTRSADFKGALVSGNPLKARVNVTTAATGTFTLRGAILIITIGFA